VSEGLRRIHIVFVVLTSLWTAGCLILAMAVLWDETHRPPTKPWEKDAQTNPFDQFDSPVEEPEGVRWGNLIPIGGIAIVPTAFYWTLAWVIAGFLKDRSATPRSMEPPSGRMGSSVEPRG